MTPVVELIRLEESTTHGTFGILRVQKQIFCATLEPPDIENARNVSSIPAQQYDCKRYASERYPDTFEVCDVPGRSGILFHAGNTVDDTAGCILLGRSNASLRSNLRQLTNSGDTFWQFMKIMPGESFHLTVMEKY